MLTPGNLALIVVMAAMAVATVTETMNGRRLPASIFAALGAVFIGALIIVNGGHCG